MVKLSDEQKNFIVKNLKPLLEEDEVRKAYYLIESELDVDILDEERGKFCSNILAWFIENGLDMLSYVNEIYEGAFMASDIESIEIPSNITTIQAYAFANCEQLTNVILHEGLETFEDTVFYNTSIRELTIPSTVRFMNFGVCERCDNLTKVTIKSMKIDLFMDTFPRNTIVTVPKGCDLRMFHPSNGDEVPISRALYHLQN